MAGTGHVLLLAPLPATLLTDEIDVDVVTASSRDEALDGAAGAVACVADWRAQLPVDAEMVCALAPTCRVVQMPAAGLDGVDLDACADAGIPVASAVGLNAVDVAEWVVWAVLDGLRGLTASDRATRRGEWRTFARPRLRLRGRSVGLVGLGAVGTRTARVLRPFGADVRYWSRTRRPREVEDELGVTWSELDPLLSDADVVVLAIASTADTAGLLSAERIAAMRAEAVVVNAARGQVVDEEALAAAVADGRLHAAVTDVFTTEPPPAGHPLVGVEEIVLTPHVAGVTSESVAAILTRVVTNVAAAVHGGELEGLVDPG